MRLLNGEVVNGIAEIILAFGIHGRSRVDEHRRLERALARVPARREVQHVMRHRYDFLVGEGRLVAYVVDQRGVSTRLAPDVRFGDEWLK